MEHVTVRIPEQLEKKIISKAEKMGISKSEKIRQDLSSIYFE